MTSKPPSSKNKSSDIKPWGGRFSEATDAFVERFTASVAFDQRLYKQDIRGSIAHADMLSKCGVISVKEFQQIRQGLLAIQDDIVQGKFRWSIQLEDVHMNIEELKFKGPGPEFEVPTPPAPPAVPRPMKEMKAVEIR